MEQTEAALHAAEADHGDLRSAHAAVTQDLDVLVRENQARIIAPAQTQTLHLTPS